MVSVAADGVIGDPLFALEQGQAPLPDRFARCRAPGNHREVMPGLGQTDGQVAANGAGARPRRSSPDPSHPPNKVTLKTRAMMTMNVNAEKTTRLVQLAHRTSGDG